MTRSASVASNRLTRSMTVLREKAPPTESSPLTEANPFVKTLPMFVAGHGLGQNDVEIFYNLNPKAENFDSEGDQATDVANLIPLDYKGETTKAVNVPLTTRKIRLGLRFFNESP